MTMSVWELGSYATIGSKLVLVAEQLCESLDIRGGARVLDVATGHGNMALAAARRECRVTGIDTSERLLDMARERAKADGLDAEFCVGDAENIPFDDASFDYVVSTFGVQFVANPARAASELCRVCAPGGRIGLANWSPSEFASALNAVMASYFSRSDAPPPDRWGTEEGVRSLLGNGVDKIEMVPRQFVYRFARPEAWLECFRRTYGPFMAVFASQTPEVQGKMARESNDVVRRFNTSGDATLVLPIAYLEIVADVKLR